MHSIFIVINVDIISITVVIVIECLSNGYCQFNSVVYSISVPIIVGPVNDAVVVMVPSRLLFSPETSSYFLLIAVEDSIVIIIRIFSIRDTVIVVINIVHSWLLKSKCHLSTIPNRLIESIIISIRVVAVIVVVYAVGS